MEEANYILKLIEKASFDNYLGEWDEINARVDCYLKKYTFIGLPGYHICEYKTLDDPYPKYLTPTNYCESRDALKIIRPEGAAFHVIFTPDDQGYSAQVARHTDEYNSYYARSPFKMPTEELAELYAIIQAIEHERNE